MDKRILRALQSDASLSHAQIAEQVNVSPSSVRRRIEAMKKSGVIRSIVALVDTEAMRESVTVVVAVTFERETHDIYRRFQHQMAAQDAVTQCYFVAGSYDAILVVMNANAAEHWEWAERELKSNADIRRFDSMFVSSTAKASARVPI